MSENPSPAFASPPPARKVIGTAEVPLKCVLTAREVEKKQALLLECYRKLRSHEQHEANVKAQLKRDRTAIESEMAACVGVLETGYEMRAVTVEKIADYDRSLIIHVRVDTGEEVDFERMPESARQTEMDLREQRARDDARPTNPDDVNGPDPWGAPATGQAPIAELPHEEIIEGEFSEDTGAAGGPETPPPEAPAAHLTPEEARIAHLLQWLPKQPETAAREFLEGADVEEVRAIYAAALGEPAGRAQKRTMIPKIMDKLFPVEF